MSVAIPFAALATALAVAALIASDFRGWRPGVWIAKPLASTGFVAVALLGGASGTAYGRTVLVALALCWLGDVLLIPRGARAAFLAGLASFLLGHVAFAVAFALRALAPAWCAAAAFGVAPAAFLALRWLRPHVPPALAAPVRAYVAAIGAMVLLAAGAAGGTGDRALLAGALAFFVSDLAVARDRFVAQTPWNRLWGLPLYYAATLLLAGSVAAAG